MRIIGVMGLVLCLAVGSVQAAEKDKKAKAPANAQASAQAKQEANALFAQGFQAYQAGNLSIAQELFENGLKKFPNDAAALYFLAEILRKQGEFDRAGPMFEQSLKLEPSGRYAIPAQGALKELQKEKELAQNKQSAKKLFAEGYDLFKAEKYAEARDKFAEGLKWDDDPKAKSLLQRAENGVKFHKGWEAEAPRLRALGVQDEQIKGTWNQLLNFDMPPLVPYKELTIKHEKHDKYGRFSSLDKNSLESIGNGVYKRNYKNTTYFQDGTQNHMASSATLIDGGLFVSSQIAGQKPTEYKSFRLSGKCFSIRLNDECTEFIDQRMFIPQQEPWDAVAESTKTNQASKTLRLDRNEYIAIKRSSEGYIAHYGQKISQSSTILFIPQLGLEVIVYKDPEWKQTIESFNGVPVNIDIKEFMRGM